MFVVCKSCDSKLSWNPKADARLAELACPKCGGSYRKSAASLRDDPEGRSALVVGQFQSAVARLESCLLSLANLPHALAEIGRLALLLSGSRQLMFDGWDRDDRPGVSS